jgi:hypothetical protein
MSNLVEIIVGKCCKCCKCFEKKKKGKVQNLSYIKVKPTEEKGKEASGLKNSK